MSRVSHNAEERLRLAEQAAWSNEPVDADDEQPRVPVLAAA
jgi:hypothetical protein